MSFLHPIGGNIFWTSVKDNIIKDKKDNKSLLLSGIYYKLFEEDDEWGSQEGIDWYLYLEHLIDLCLGDWVDHLSKMNEAVGERNKHKKVAGNTWLVCFIFKEGFLECIGCILSAFICGKKG